jgi:hypothetical protein
MYACPPKPPANTPCVPVQVSGNGGYQWDSAWQVENMPDRRCIFDGVLLPNGHVMLLGGQRVSGGVVYVCGGGGGGWLP